jgi:hypothetical protein
MNNEMYYEEFGTLEDEKRYELESELRDMQEEYDDVIDEYKYYDKQKEIVFDDEVADIEVKLDGLWERKEELERAIERKKDEIEQLDIWQEGE